MDDALDEASGGASGRNLTLFMAQVDAYTTIDGGDWHYSYIGSVHFSTTIHAIRMKDGRIWDRCNGWRKKTSVHPMQQLPVLSTEEAKEQKLTYADLPKPDMVHQPAHYSRWKMQPIEFIAINDLPFWLANLIKYAMRYDAKDGLQDLYKARSYLDMQIRKVEGEPRFWEKPVEEERKLNGK